MFLILKKNWILLNLKKMSIVCTEQLPFLFLWNENTIFKNVPYDIYMYLCIDIFLLNSNIFRTEIAQRKLTLILLKLSKLIT